MSENEYYFDLRDTDSRVLADIRELLYIQAQSVSVKLRGSPLSKFEAARMILRKDQDQ